MGLKEDIQNKVKAILDTTFNVTDIKYVPKLDDTKLTFGNTGLKFTGAVVYIDIRGSTKLLNIHNRTTVAKLHMSFFHAIVKIANSLGGNVRSFNGDSTLIFFHGSLKDATSTAVKCAMQITYMLSHEEGIRKLLEKYSALDFGIGIDHGEIICTKIGVGGEHNKDIFWVGNSVNKSTVLGDESKSPKHISISKIAYDNLNDDVKYGTQTFNGNKVKVDMWEQSIFQYNDENLYYYKTGWHWKV